MISRNYLVLLNILLVLMLTACATSNATPTPTIVQLDRSAIEATATFAAANPTPTRTPIPLPSPTPTTTPFPATNSASPAPTAASAPAEAAEMIANPAARVEIITSALYLRAGPGLEYEVIGGAREGDQFGVTGISASGRWLQIITVEGDPGWISAKSDYTRLISAEAEDLPVIGASSIAPGSVAPVDPIVPDAAPIGQTATLQNNGTTGGRLVFATSSGGDLYLINADGSGLRRITGGVIDPVVSPVGQQVAFTRWDSGELGTLYTINLDGSNEQAILGETLQAKSPTWSPDGRSIAVSFQQGGLRNPTEECRTFDADDGIRIPRDIAEITRTSFRNGEFRICFIRREDLQWLLRQVDVASGNFEDLPVDLYSYTPAWDPQNPWRVVYDGEKGLMQLDVNTGSNTPLTTDLRDTAPVFSPDGQRLALTYKQHDHWEVYTLAVNDPVNSRQRLTKPPLLADPQYNSAAPAWSPDGSQIAFLTDRSGSWEIWVMNADGSEPHPLFPPEIQAQLGLEYHGVNERLLNWIQ